MTKGDFKRQLKHLYLPSAKEFVVVDVPPMQFLMVDGHGDPNTAQEYTDAIEALYAVAYRIKFTSKKALGLDYVVPPLEGLWWAQDMETFDKVAGFYMHESLYYFRNHTWLELERNGKYRVGIDDFARRIIGRVKGIKLPAVGRDLDLEEYAWTVQHEYGDIEFFSPLNGVVESINQELLEDTGLVTDQPYTGGWLMTNL